MSKHVDQAEIRRVAAMWTEVIRLQVSRLEDAVDRFHEAIADQQLRAAFDQAGRPTPWAKEVRKARRSLTEKDVAAVAADQYFLLLAAAQLTKCVDLLPHDGLPKLQDARLLTLLRNLAERWEDPHGHSATALRELISDITPGRLQYNKHDIWVEGMSVVSLLQWAEDVDQRIRDAVANPSPSSP